MCRFAFPDNENVPAQRLQTGLVVGVPGGIAGQLRVPVAGVRFWPAAVSAALERMLVPEAAMHEDHLSASGKDEIRFSRKILPVEPEPVPHRVGKAPDGQFRRRVL